MTIYQCREWLEPGDPQDPWQDEPWGKSAKQAAEIFAAGLDFCGGDYAYIEVRNRQSGETQRIRVNRSESFAAS